MGIISQTRKLEQTDILPAKVVFGAGLGICGAEREKIALLFPPFQVEKLADPCARFNLLFSLEMIC